MRSWIFGFLWKDAKLFFVDRQAVVMSFIVPVLIASILGWLDSKATSTTSPAPVHVLITDEDGSIVSKAILKRMKVDPSVAIEQTDRKSAEKLLRQGDISALIVIPSGLGATAIASLSGGPKPSAVLMFDPSRPIETEIVKGAFYSDASTEVVRTAFGSLAGDGSAPVSIAEYPLGPSGATWSRAAHDYAGFGLQGLLFFAIESAVSLARERRLGIWRRLRASPVPMWVMLLSRGLSSTVLAFGIILAIFAVGALLFGIRVTGSGLGFFLIALSAAAMAAMFGLMVTTIGKTESQSRAISILLILTMLATGGAWFPMQQMPDSVQKAASFLPVRWAVEGFDAVTWRGYSLMESAKYFGILASFAAIFGILAVVRFRDSD